LTQTNPKSGQEEKNSTYNKNQNSKNNKYQKNKCKKSSNRKKNTPYMMGMKHII